MGFSFTPLFDPEDYRRALVDNEFNVASVFQQMMADAPDRHRVFVEEYNKVMEKCRSLLATRNDEDYNQMVALPDYFPFGEYSYCHMLFLKCMRAINQILAGSDPSDSLEDLINYAAFTAAWFQLRGEGRIPEVSYGPANPAKRRSEMERELFQSGPEEEKEGVDDRDIEEYLKDSNEYFGLVPSPGQIRSYLERRGIMEEL